ncbi:MAG TPA: bifunctional nuclease family protein [Methanosarcinales archaeon]|nr:bifunctional nuclease family protein [Methanosarcinales archaeon]
MDVVDTTVKGVYMVGGPKQMAPVVLLSDEEGRIMPIFVGHSEAMSIHLALRREMAPRPMTHDLMVLVLDELGGSVKNVLVDDLNEGTFYARLVLDVQDTQKEIDARPSDCIAIAVRTGSPIRVRESLFSQVAIESSEFEGISSLDEYITTD